ncbi:hypothetical protein QBC39DRAFT_398245 [Podospora conica]|nr:hypothetical protein QBC39DRAFT_398245 [Schizothecium conicum]
MVHLKALATSLALLLSATPIHAAPPSLLPRQNLPDPAGAKNLGNGRGIQFIGGQCLSAADCASGCCATLPRGGETIGVCSGVGAQFQAGKQGCGFGGAAPAAPSTNGNGSSSNNTPPATGGAGTGGADTTGIQPSPLKPDPAGARNVGNGRGAQFITGGCLSNADCASNCCATVNTGTEPAFGICSGPAVSFQNGKQGCGFTGGAATGSNNEPPSNGSVEVVPVPDAPPAQGGGGTVKPSGLVPDVNGVKNVGNGRGEQFITGECLSDADCASGCCALVNTGEKRFGICSGPAVSFQNGKQGCGFPVGGR